MIHRVCADRGIITPHPMLVIRSYSIYPSVGRCCAGLGASRVPTAIQRRQQRPSSRSRRSAHIADSRAHHRGWIDRASDLHLVLA
jgi:hypothetical protein